MWRDVNKNNFFPSLFFCVWCYLFAGAKIVKLNDLLYYILFLFISLRLLSPSSLFYLVPSSLRNLVLINANEILSPLKSKPSLLLLWLINRDKRKSLTKETHQFPDPTMQTFTLSAMTVCVCFFRKSKQKQKETLNRNCTPRWSKGNCELNWLLLREPTATRNPYVIFASREGARDCLSFDLVRLHTDTHTRTGERARFDW